MHLLSNSGAEVQHVCLAQCREAFSAMLSERQAAEAAEAPKEEGTVEVARLTLTPTPNPNPNPNPNPDPNPNP